MSESRHAAINAFSLRHITITDTNGKDFISLGLVPANRQFYRMRKNLCIAKGRSRNFLRCSPQIRGICGGQQPCLDVSARSHANKINRGNPRVVAFVAPLDQLPEDPLDFWRELAAAERRGMPKQRYTSPSAFAAIGEDLLYVVNPSLFPIVFGDQPDFHDHERDFQKRRRTLALEIVWWKRETRACPEPQSVPAQRGIVQDTALLNGRDQAVQGKTQPMLAISARTNIGLLQQAEFVRQPGRPVETRVG